MTLDFLCRLNKTSNKSPVPLAVMKLYNTSPIKTDHLVCITLEIPSRFGIPKTIMTICVTLKHDCLPKLMDDIVTFSLYNPF